MSNEYLEDKLFDQLAIKLIKELYWYIENIYLGVLDILVVLIPNPFCLNKKTFKAFVLGADQTNFSDNVNPIKPD